MKHFIIILIVLIAIPMNAQNNCSSYYPFTKGKTVTIHQLDRKDRLSTITTYKVADVKSSGSETTISIDMTVFDGESKDEIAKVQFDAICTNGTTRLDPESMVSPQLFEQYKDMTYTVEGTAFSFPNTLEVGQKLKDAEIKMNVDAGIMKMNMTVSMTDRMVTKQEKITTNAGTFDCYVITYKNQLEMGLKQTNYTTQWIAEGVGLVKEETLKSNGKPVSKSLLESIN
ncbi:MAG: TapB family protein [Aquaticitalea sp.]